MNEKIMKKCVLASLLFTGVLILSLLLFACNNQIDNAFSGGGESAVSLSVTKSVPAIINSASITVEGEGMETVSQSVEADETSLTLELPAGEARTFSMTMSNDTVTFSGSVTQDLTAGEEVDITLPLQLTGTEIVVTDADYYGYTDPDYEGGRIVQIDDMTAAGWTEKDWEDFSSSIGYDSTGDFVPCNVDFDDRGRIYVANNSTSMGGIIRLDDITDTSPEAIVTGTQVPALAVDRANGYVYYIDGSDNGSLKRYNYNTGQVDKEYTVSFTVEEWTRIGLTVDDDGMVYIACESDTNVSKFNPSGEGSVEKEYLDAVPRDVLFKNGYIYVADLGNDSPARVGKMTKELVLEDELQGKPDDTDPFLGPSLFLAVVRDKIYVIDEYDYDIDADNRIVAFEDISGAGWTTYQNSTDPFAFFLKC